MGSAGSNITHVVRDAEEGYRIPLTHGERKNAGETRKFSNLRVEIHVSQAACISSFLFQVVFQVDSFARRSSFSVTEK